MPPARTSPRLPAALVLAFVCLALATAAPAPARAEDGTASHTAAHVAIGAGIGLTVGSFLLAEAGDRAYERYQTETDPTLIEEHYDSARRYDQLAAGTLIAGQVCLVYGLWRRFLHDPSRDAAQQVDPDRGPTWSLAPALGPDGPVLAFDVRF